MDKRRLWKPVLLLVLILFSGLYVLPSLMGEMPSWYPFQKKLNYGLDLKGGLELRYTVDWKKAIGDNTLKVREGVIERIVGILAENDEKDPEALSDADRLAYETRFEVSREDFDSLLVSFKDAADAKLLTPDEAERIDPYYRRQKVDDTTIRLRLLDARVAEIKDQVVEQTLDTFRKRVEAFGLVEPDVRQNGETDIDVQLPGVTKSEMDMVRERLGQTAQLLFRMVDDKVDPAAKYAEALATYKKEHPDRARTLDLKRDPLSQSKRTYFIADNKSELIGFFKTLDLPEDHTFGFEKIVGKNDAGAPVEYYRAMYLFSKVELSGETLARAMVMFKQEGTPYVSVEFDARGARIFRDVTRAHVDDRMAIMLDDEVTSAPVINEEIGGGRAMITMGGARNPQEVLADARGLVTVLNQGAYRAPVHKVHDFEVGPSLGRDSIKAGTTSIIVGSILVILFILIYYRLSGLVANVALALNILFILAVLVSFDTALTLPGLAGIVLTIGMAVDANVIIFERIREELRNGKTARVAIDTGYAKAFWTIFDANITTALAGFILLNYTSGPIQGFAKTLLIGIVSSMFTAIVVTRMVFRLWIERRKVETLSI